MRISDWSSDVCSSDLGNNNIAESIVGQLQHERYPEPAWIVCGAGTGGTSAPIGRYMRYRGLRTRLCVAEPTGMAFARAWPPRDHRSAERRVGRECVSTRRSRWSQQHSKTKYTEQLNTLIYKLPP